MAKSLEMVCRREASGLGSLRSGNVECMHVVSHSICFRPPRMGPSGTLRVQLLPDGLAGE